MKKRMKRILSVVLAGVMVFSLAACGNEKKEQENNTGDTGKTLRVLNWGTAEEEQIAADAIARFNEKNPDVEVKQTCVPVDSWSDFIQKWISMTTSGETPDVINIGLEAARMAVSNELLMPLDEIVENDESLSKLKSEYAESLINGFSVDGKLYGLPNGTQTMVMYYNKKMFDDAGIEYPKNLTWDEYEDLAKKLSKNDGQVYGAYQHIWRSTIQAIAAAQNEANLVEPDYQYMTDYYDRALRMQKEGAQMDFGTAKSTKVTYQSQFEEQKAAMMYMGTWYMAGILANKEASKTEVEWGITAIPQKKKGESVTTFGSPTAFAVNKNSKKQKAAQEFIEFAASEEGAKVLAGVGVVLSYRTDEIDQLYFNLAGMPTDEISKKAFSPDEIKLEFPIDTYGPAIDKILQEEYDLVLVGDETPEKGTVNMEKRVAAEKE